MYSITQTSNLVIIAGLISMILAKFKINIGSEEIQTWLGLIVAVVGTALSWYNRYKKGDLTMGGFRK